MRSAAALLLLLPLASPLLAQGTSRSPSHRHGGHPRNPTGPVHQANSVQAATFPFELRSINGSGNNPVSPELGAAGHAMTRLSTLGYGDGVASPAGAGRPSARAISNAVAAQTESIPNTVGASSFVWQWGQFLDHDLDETPIAAPAEEFDILVPADDALFDPTGSGTATIPLDRSDHVIEAGVREQMNAISSFLDASNVYGAEESRTLALRTLDGSGRLKTSAGDLLPYNVDQLPNAPSTSPSLFLAGDVRANEQIGLTAMHTLFVREHNFWADALRPVLPGVSGDVIFEFARTMVIAEMQAITYREFLPVLLGAGALRPYPGYRIAVDPRIANVFATAAYRVGHTMLPEELLRLDATMTSIPEGPLPLASAFFSPATFLASGMESVLRGLAAQEAQAIDPYVVDGVRNFLFGPPGAGGFDLVALNIQRGRDHGLPSFNQLRADYGLLRRLSFAALNPDPEVRGRLESIYQDVDQVDAWVGLLAEAPANAGMVGPTLRRILVDQFERLRDGDRFWYASYLPDEIVSFVNEQTLSVILKRNTDIDSEIEDNVFLIPGAGGAGTGAGHHIGQGGGRRR